MDLAAPRGLALERKTPIRHLDPTLILSAIALSVYGSFMIYSATRKSLEALGEDPSLFLKRQIGFTILGVIGLLLIATFDYRLVKVYAPFLYGGLAIALLLVMVPHVGTKVSGAQRWITILGFQFQPSEPAKLGLIAMLAAYLSERRGELTLRIVLRCAAFAALPMGLVFLQPDVGTAISIGAILVSLLLIAGTRPRHLLVLALAATTFGFLAFHTGIVKDYQIERIRAFLDSEADAQRAGYNREQSEIAIGHGGLTGTGYLNGSQTNLDFVPAQHTDFIFTAIAEELGFVGAMFLLMLFALLFWRGFRIAALSKDLFGTYLATGIVAIMAFQVFVNAGMTMGIMPITGIPLPFISFGGSAMITNFLLVGLLLNVHMRRFK